MQNLANIQRLGFQRFMSPSREKRLQAYIKSLSGLFDYYPMNEKSGTTAINQAPATKGTLDGTISGATINQAGLVGPAYSFDGVNDNVDLGNNSQFEVGTGSITFGFIFYQRNSTTAKFPFSTRSTSAGTSAGYEIIINSGVSGDIQVRSANGTAQTTAPVINAATDRWHLAIGIIDRNANQISLYVDKLNISQTALSTTSIGNSQTPRFGERGGNYFNDSLQHGFFLNRPITNAERLQIATIAGL